MRRGQDRVRIERRDEASRVRDNVSLRILDLERVGMAAGGKRRRIWDVGEVRCIQHFGAGHKRDQLAVDPQLGRGRRHNGCTHVVGPERELVNGGIDRRQEEGSGATSSVAQRDESGLRRSFAEHDGVRAQPAPASLAGRQFITVVDRHAETELRPEGQWRHQPERSDGQLDFVDGLIVQRITAHHCGCSAGACFVHDNSGSERCLNAAEGIVVKSDLCRSIRAGNHQLDGIPVPRAVGRVLMVIVGYDEPEVNVLSIIDNLNR